MAAISSPSSVRRYDDHIVASGSMATGEANNNGYIERCQIIRKNIDECQAMLTELTGALPVDPTNDTASPPGRANTLDREIYLIGKAVNEMLDSIRNLVNRF